MPDLTKAADKLLGAVRGAGDPGGSLAGRLMTHSKVWLFMAGFSFLLVWAGFRFFERFGLLVGFFLAMSLNVLVLTYSEWRVVPRFQGQELEGVDAWGLLRLVKSMARTAGVDTPTLVLLENEIPFALSAGVFRPQTRIFFSTGLLDRLTIDEVRAVIGYHIERLKNEQTRATTAISALASLFLILAGALDAALLVHLWRKNASRAYPGPFTFLISPFVSLLMRLAVRRTAVLRTDRATADRHGNALTLARALGKLDAYNKTMPFDANLAEAALFVVNPLARDNWGRMLSTQPTVEERVRALVGRYPI